MERGTHVNAEQARRVQDHAHAHDARVRPEFSTEPNYAFHTHEDSECDQQHVANTLASTSTSQHGAQAVKRRIPKKRQDSQQTNAAGAQKSVATITTTTVYVSDTPCNPGQPTTLWGRPFRQFSYHIRDAFINTRDSLSTTYKAREFFGRSG